MKATRLTTDIRQAVVWFVLNNSPEVDADILAYRECHTPRRGLDGTRVRRRDLIDHLNINSDRQKWTPHQLMMTMANANEGNAEDDDMACLALRSHGGEAGGSPPRQPNRPVPAQFVAMLRLETGNASLRKAFRENNKQPLQLGSCKIRLEPASSRTRKSHDILDKSFRVPNQPDHVGKGGKLPGGGSTSRRRGPQAFPDAISREGEGQDN
ncbi:hypothetical protein Tco_0662764 [Tanacetum coccineum]